MQVNEMNVFINFDQLDYDIQYVLQNVVGKENTHSD